MLEERDRELGEVAGLLASMAAGVAGVGFVVSVIFDIGYYAELGYPMSELPTTFSDHVRSSINLISYVFSGLLALIGYELLTRRIEKGQTEEEIIQSTSNPKFTRKLRDSPYYLIFVLSLLGVVLYWLLGDMLKLFVPYAVCFLWAFFAGWCQRSMLIQTRRPRSLRLALIYIPAVALFVYFQGERVAFTDVHGGMSDTNLYFTNGGSTTVKVLRSLEKGFLVYPVGGDITFIPIDTVSKVVRTVKPRTELGYLGRSLHSWVRKKHENAPASDCRVKSESPAESRNSPE